MKLACTRGSARAWEAQPLDSGFLCALCVLGAKSLSLVDRQIKLKRLFTEHYGHAKAPLQAHIPLLRVPKP